MQNRRSFIKVAGTAMGGIVLLPEFLKAIPLSEREISSSKEDLNNILVVVQLSGGNDGLNTFIPYGNQGYYDLRGPIAIPKNQILTVNDAMGWHPSMKGFAEMMQNGHLSVFQNVGYPNANRSHFRSMEIWQTAVDADEYSTTGWLGRYLDATCSEHDVLAGINLSNYDTLAFQGKTSHDISLQNPELFENQIKALDKVDDPNNKNDNLEYVRKLAVSAFEGSDKIKEAMKKTADFKADKYPTSPLGKNMYWVSRMIKGNLPTKVYYTSLGGFDTHINQLGPHKNQLDQVSGSLTAFYNDMKESNLIDRVTVVVFSEFGRRVKVNGSNGTDHGAAAPMFVIGGKNKGKIYGNNPDLVNLNQGDLMFQQDFRNIYATILKQKFNVNPSVANLKGFDMVDLF